MRASWAAAVTEGLNSLGVMGPAHTLVRDGAGGFGFAPLPENKRFRSGLSGLSPFLVRHVEATGADDEETTERIPYTGWEIYMPEGCVAVGGTCEPLNPKAYRETDDGRKDLDGWYRLPAPDGEGSDGDHWTVTVHAKCCAAHWGVDEIQNWPRQYAWAEISKAWDESMSAQEIQEAQEENVNDVGDTFSSAVGAVTWSEKEDDEGNIDTSWSYSHGVRVPIHIASVQGSMSNRLYFAFSIGEESLELELEKIYLYGASIAMAGLSFGAVGLFEVKKDDEEVYFKIDTTTDPYGVELKAYKEIKKNEAEGNLTVNAQIEEDRKVGEAFILVYRLKNGHVVDDNRINLRPELYA